MEGQLDNVDLPKNYKIVLTGKGRVGGGALETISCMPQIKEVTPVDFLAKDFDHPVYTVLGVQDYNKTKDGSAFDKQQFYADPTGKFESDFLKYAQVADMYIACHYWDNRSPFIFTREDAKHAETMLRPS